MRHVGRNHDKENWQGFKQVRLFFQN